MAKCVACTSINALLEAKKHPGPSSEGVSRLLKSRWNNTDRLQHNRYCRFHDNKGTGRATWSEAKASIPKLLEIDRLAEQARIAREQEEVNRVQDLVQA